MKMAPGPDQQQQEPAASDKSTGGGTNVAATTSPASSTSASYDSQPITAPPTSLASGATALVFPLPEAGQGSSGGGGGGGAGGSGQEAALPILNNAALVDSKQEEPATLSTLNEGELRALLDEAITYKCPKDREGKSNLFKELLQEAEADESEEGRWTVTSGSSGGGSSRCLPGTNRSRRHKRDSVSEHLTHGGSLQNLAREPGPNSEFDSGFAYLVSGSSQTYAGGPRRSKQKRHPGPSVSARQREGGSLPSNVNATHTLASLANFDLVFEKKKGLSEEKSVYDWTNKEKSKSLDKPSYDRYSKKEEKEKERKESKLSGSCDIESELRDKRSSNRGKLGTNEMLESDNPPPEYNKQDCMVIGLEDFEASVVSERNASAALGGVQRPRSLDAEDDEGTEMKIIDHRRPVQFITRATFDITQTPVDSTIEFPTFREHTTKLEKSKINVNGTEGTSSLPFPQYNNVKCVMSGPPNVYSVMSWPSPNISMVSRLTAQHIPGKESSLSGEKKSLDENGNAVQVYNGEKKKPRRKNAQEPNVIVYQSENVKGHRNEDIDILISFIENKECKSKKGKASNSIKVKAASNTKSRSRDNKDIKREQIPAKLQKSNSLEEISKTKLKDLTTEKSTTSSGSSSVSSQHGSINVALRRTKQRSTGDTTVVDSRGDRRSWGTEEGQSIYCNDTGDDYSSRRNSVKKNNVDYEAETEFHVVTNKKKKAKKQRRSSSGGRAQNLTGSGSYLQRGRGFNNDYRTPLSPELRRKSASSMPPSDKSDSSDLDSVHSLPVTSNSSKHNSSKTVTSSSSAPQASYADIARMATLNMPATPVLNISNLMPNVINTAAWPTVASSKNNTEIEKLPNDYYPSLDELQHSDRKLRQQSFAQQGPMSVSLDKPPSPTMPKSKLPTEGSKKTQEAQEEAMSKVVKYVQDIEKMQQENKQSINNSSLNSNETTPTNPLPPKLPESSSNFSSPPEMENSSNSESTKDLNANVKSTRIRKNHPQNSGSGNREYSTTQSQSQIDESRDSKKFQSSLPDEMKVANPIQSQQDDKDVKKMASAHNVTAGPSEIIDSAKTRIGNNVLRSVIDAETARVNKTEKLSKASKDQQQINSKDTLKVCYQQQTPNCRQDKPGDDLENKKSKQSNSINKSEKEQKVTENYSINKVNPLSITTTTTTTASTRPAVILLDENVTDQSRSTESESSELIFGFEINEQLLLSEEEDEGEDEAPTAGVDLSHYANSGPHFSQPPPMFDKHVRCDKFPPNFPINPYMYVHPIPPPHPVLAQTMSAYMSCQMRFQAQYMLPQHPPPPVIEKCRNQPKEDFSSRYIAPDESHVQKFNHDKIVSFVGLAWDDVMRETGSASSGRVQYYSGQ
ncbi:PREDICTED: uncharacterized protein DDB_G0284459 [Ceratosolen solmsi marchali]|uniref:Uncharacterized protein DDB_G0284459 n=1 Tax=Ceratosolen solmsi marchali TaxID=326594 RepID=A0AAJ6YI12_9HYME|nr:PREDICTED: uncharacterized protein DDB_G0284459 [Ceratosolen solmsi marchali]